MENNRVDLTAVRESLIDAALAHVVFDGWSEAALRAAAVDTGIDLGLAYVLFPRGAAGV